MVNEMKIVLSRKGFDGEFGGMPSPILPDGTLLSMPIPNVEDDCTYDDLTYYVDGIGTMKYNEILNDLYTNSSKSGIEQKYANNKYKGRCHLDPDIREGINNKYKNLNWIPAFGQSGGAESHLRKQHIGKGDIFLFFGWFRETEVVNHKLRFKNNIDLQVIYGFLQVSNRIEIENCCKTNIPCLWHPHLNLQKYNAKGNNAIYLATDQLEIDGKVVNKGKKVPGFGTLKITENNIFDSPLVLTKKDKTRTRWDKEKIKWFDGKRMTHHSYKSYKEKGDYFQSANIGQEFVMYRYENKENRGDVEPKTRDELKNLIINHLE